MIFSGTPSQIGQKKQLWQLCLKIRLSGARPVEMGKDLHPQDFSLTEKTSLLSFVTQCSSKPDTLPQHRSVVCHWMKADVLATFAILSARTEVRHPRFKECSVTPLWRKKSAETECDRVMLHLSVRHKLCSGWATKPFTKGQSSPYEKAPNDLTKSVSVLKSTGGALVIRRPGLLSKVLWLVDLGLSWGSSAL